LRSITACREYSRWARRRTASSGLDVSPPGGVHGRLLRMAKFLLRRFDDVWVPIQHRDVSELGPREVGDLAHGPVDDFEPDPATVLSDLRVVEVHGLPTVRAERLALIADQERPLLALAPQPEEVDGIGRVLTASVFCDIGAHFVQC